LGVVLGVVVSVVVVCSAGEVLTRTSRLRVCQQHSDDEPLSQSQLIHSAIG
jgi:hypothetical protein